MPRPIVQEIRAVDKTQRAFSSITGSINQLRGLMAGLGAVVTTGVFANFTKNAINSSDEIQKLSQRLGASTEALSEYKLVAELTGVSFRTLTTGLQRATRRISEAASGTGEAKNALAELGLEASALNNLRPEQQFEILADALMNVGNQSDQVRLAMRLFDTEGVALIQTMQGGSKAIQDMRKQARDLGLSLSQDAVNSAAAANDALTRFGALTTALGLTLAKALAPAIAAIVTWLQNNLPNAVQIAIDAFDALQRFVLNVAGVVTAGLSKLSSGLAAAADFVGADTLSKALGKTADDYENVSRTIAKASVRIASTADANNNLSTALQTGITFNQLYNAELAKGVSKTEAKTNATRKLKEATDAGSDSIARYLENLQREVDILGLSNVQLREYELRKLGAEEADIARAKALQEEIEIFEEINKVEEENQRIMERSAELMKQQAETTKKVKNEWEGFGQIVGSSFEDAIVEGAKLSDVLKGLEKDLIRLVTRNLVTKPLSNFLGDIAGSLFGGVFGRAAGGPVFAGQPYIVGERGPEIVVPGTSSNVIPSDKAFGANINVYISPQVGTNPEVYRQSARQGALEGTRALQLARGIT